MLKDVMAKLVRHETLTRAEAAAAMTDIMSGRGFRSADRCLYYGLAPNGRNPFIKKF
ncbi:hypothetical protein P4C99_07765 [Pontiellaceae bacterium B1224]|nr:hypothetical protein [Pontiellaceae bacterium B1224]